MDRRGSGDIASICVVFACPTLKARGTAPFSRRAAMRFSRQRRDRWPMPAATAWLLKAWSSHVDPAHNGSHTQEGAPLRAIAFVSSPPDGLRPHWRRNVRQAPPNAGGPFGPRERSHGRTLSRRNAPLRTAIASPVERGTQSPPPRRVNRRFRLSPFVPRAAQGRQGERGRRAWCTPFAPSSRYRKI